MTKIINCTPHAVVVNGVTFQPSGINPRVGVVETPAEQIFMCSEICQKGLRGHCGHSDTQWSCERFTFPCVSQKTGEVQGLPDPEVDTFFIVSGMVFAATDRQDVIAPDTGKTAIRNDAGQIVGVTRFIRK